MSQQTRIQEQKAARRRQEMRASLLLPIGITFVVWLAGLGAYLLLPDQFYGIVTLLVGLGLILFLVIWTRNADKRTRRWAIILAVPALIGIAFGMVYGSASYTMLGVGVTLALLFLQRLIDTPISFRFAQRQFSAGNNEVALDLVSRSIQARPDFWQSYQLRALIYLTLLDFPRAERDAREAISHNAKAHPAYNTLGQILLAQNRFTEVEAIYDQALNLDPDLGLYYYYLGLAQYRQGKYDEAADALASATQATLPLPEYDLQAYYYLARSLSVTGDNKLAAQAETQMAKFADGLYPLKRQLENQPDYPHLPLMQADIADMEKRLGNNQRLKIAD
ncbi:MAG: tetratricopeptide repeat protein [Chloroflexi bacterium]|nr:tetratricopeptide repeat protein [Chloroflexota bacterium]